MAYTGSVQYGDTVALTGGYDNSGNQLNTVIVYDHEAGSWISLDADNSLGVPRSWVTSFLVDQNIFPEC